MSEYVCACVCVCVTVCLCVCVCVCVCMWFCEPHKRSHSLTLASKHLQGVVVSQQCAYCAFRARRREIETGKRKEKDGFLRSVPFLFSLFSDRWSVQLLF